MRVLNSSGRLSLEINGNIVDVDKSSGGRFGPDPHSAFLDWDAFRSWATTIDPTTAHAGPVSADALGPPVPRPRQVFAIGQNYRSHAAEAGLEVPTSPPVFTKFPSCIVGPHASVELPASTVDWEIELVVVIGKSAHRVAAENAWSYVAGFTAGQDLSERRLQTAGKPPQFSLGKSYTGFGPTGPALVTLDEIPDRDNVKLGCRLEGGDVLQDGRTGDLIFAVPELVARLSFVCELFPGDLIFTGTPDGTGVGRDPRVFLKPGDVLVSWVEGVGELRNVMTASANPTH
jgi:2,4-didehydro-3-deoxy-L-rhamnonate hydrolase